MWVEKQARDMPELRIREEQAERLAELREELATAHAGPYASVAAEDAMEYLLDLADATSDLDPPVESEAGSAPAGDSTAETEESTASDASGAGQTDADELFDLLETHSEKWREASGDEPYEVDLPGGETTTVRTKDDVKATLFREYR